MEILCEIKTTQAVVVLLFHGIIRTCDSNLSHSRNRVPFLMDGFLQKKVKIVLFGIFYAFFRMLLRPSTESLWSQETTPLFLRGLETSRCQPFILKVFILQFQLDILTAVLDTESKDHVFAGLPTGWGKSLPMLLISALSPPGQKYGPY